MCTHTDTKGKTEKGQSTEYFKNFRKNKIFNDIGYRRRVVLSWQGKTILLRKYSDEIYYLEEDNWIKQNQTLWDSLLLEVPEQ